MSLNVKNNLLNGRSLQFSSIFKAQVRPNLIYIFLGQNVSLCTSSLQVSMITYLIQIVQNQEYEEQVTVFYLFFQ